MRFAQTFALMTCSLLAFSTLSSAKEGGASSGGGSIYFAPGSSEPVLLDLAIAQPGFRDTHQFRFSPPAQKYDQISKKLFNTAPIDVQTQQAYSLATQRLQAWRSVSPTIADSIQRTLDHTVYVMTDLDLPVTSRYAAPQSFDRSRIQTAVYYAPEAGAILSKKLVPRMGDRSQAGLLVHEALRQMQLAYGDDITDEAIQSITARVMLEEPGAGRTLQVAGWHASSVQAPSDEDDSLVGKMNSLCGKLEALKNRYPGETDAFRPYANCVREQQALQAAGASTYTANQWMDAFGRIRDSVLESFDQLVNLAGDDLSARKQAGAALLDSQRCVLEVQIGILGRDSIRATADPRRDGMTQLEAYCGHVSALRKDMPGSRQLPSIDADCASTNGQNDVLTGNAPLVQEAIQRANWLMLEIDLTTGRVRVVRR